MEAWVIIMALIVDNKIIETPVKDIIELLRQQLFLNKVDRLDRIEIKQNNIRVTCPFHAGGHERTPSCDILMEDKGTTSAGVVHCFAAGTQIPTQNGLKSIETLIDRPTTIINGNGQWETTQFKCYGESLVYDILLKRDTKVKHIYATPNHEWFIYKGGIKQTCDLKKGDRLESVLPSIAPFTLIEEAVRWGIIFADGTRNTCYSHPKVPKIAKRLTNKEKILGHTYTINISHKTLKPALVKFFNTPDWTISNILIKNTPFIRIQSKRLKKDINLKTTLPAITASRDFKMSFLAGYFACDGSIKGNSFSTVNSDHMKYLRDLFVSCGVAIRDCTKSVRKPGKTYLKNKESIIYTTRIIFETVPNNFFLLEQPILSSKKYLRSRWHVDSIQLCRDIVPVYCCETSTQSFVIEENILTHNCFGCGYRAGIVKFIADCLNISYRKATEWLLSVSTYSLLEEIEDFSYLDIDTPTEESIKWPIVPLEELKQYDNMHPYMHKRKLTDEIIEKFEVGYDPKLDAITFPLYVNGQCVLVAKRRTKFKRFDMPKIDPKPIYGLDYLTDNEVIVCESIINALTCWSYGKQAVALCGTGSTWQIEQLNNIPQRKIILALDGDEAGRNGTKRLLKGLTNKIVTVLKLPEGKDINDLSKEEFENLEEEI